MFLRNVPRLLTDYTALHPRGQSSICSLFDFRRVRQGRQICWRKFVGYVGQYILSSFLLNDTTRVEAGSNTSIVALRVVGGDGKGSLESETVKYGR
jgi:hypothetical protein